MLLSTIVQGKLSGVRNQCNRGETIMADEVDHYTVQVVVPAGSYEADILLGKLVDLVDNNSTIEVVSVELTNGE